MSITPEIDLETYDAPHCPECFSEVDTWAVEKRAIEQERERIIKLLEDNQLLKETKLKKWLFAQGFRFAIALIKGENK